MVELMMVIVITGVVLAAALPSFREAIERSRVASQINDLNAAISFARSEAIRRNQPTYVCGSNADGSACGTNWSEGWMVWSDADRDGSFDAGEELRNGKIDSADNLVFVNGTPFAVNLLGFSARGTRIVPSNGGTFTLKPDTCPAGKPLVRRVIISPAGAAINMCIQCGTEGNPTPTRC